MAFEASVQAKAIDLIRLVLEMTTEAGSGHPSSSASLAHLITVLLYDHLRHIPADPANPAADRLVLSEGHACPIVYAAGADLGIGIGKDLAHLRPMTRKDAMSLREIGSPIDGHPNPAEGFPFFPAPTGSLGQGLSISAGLALAARLDEIPKRIYCIIGDGESREGQIWEAVDFIRDHHIVSVCPIFNENGLGQSDAVSPQQSPRTTMAKLQAAGFEVREIDGHDPAQVRAALREHASRGSGSAPFAILARTVKGWGVTLLQGPGHHGKPLAKEDLPTAMKQLDAVAREVGARWTEGDLTIPPLPATRPHAQRPISAPPSFPEALRRFGQEKALAKGSMAPRKAYGIALRALGHADPRVVALDGDVKNSTYAEEFAHDPALAHRYFECRIAEQNLFSCAAGLASAGKVPFASTFGKFVTRAYDQIEMALIGRFNLKIIGSHVGVTLASDGPSQMALPDVAFFRAFSEVRHDGDGPLLHVITPADAYAAYALTVDMSKHSLPCYLRTLRPDVPFLYDENTPFALGGHRILAQGGDLLVLASGYMVHEARKALPQLAAQGIEPTLVDLYSLPFDAREVVRLALEAGGRVLTIEDNYAGGIGSAVAEVLLSHGGQFTFRQRLVRRIPKSARTPDDLLRYLELSADDIVKEAVGMMAGTPSR